jgi:hypothetical protein
MSSTPEQHRLDTALRVGGALVVIGLVAAAVIIALYYLGAPMPGTWAYFVVLLAPAGFALVLTALVAVAVRRRRDAMTGSPHPGEQAD